MSRNTRPLWTAIAAIVLGLGVIWVPIDSARADHAQAIFKSAIDAHLHRQYIRAVDLYTEAINTDEFSGLMLARAYSSRAADYLRLGEYRRALEDLDQALLLDPNSGDAVFNRGISYDGLGEYRRAIEDFDRALQLGSSLRNFFARVYYKRGNTYYDLGELRRAIEDYDQALELNRKYVRAYGARGGAYGDLGEHRRAIEDFGEALRLNPDVAGLYRRRGLSHLLLAEFGPAASDFAQAQGRGDYDAYTVLWRYMSLARDGASLAQSTLGSDTENLDLSVWPGPVVRMFMGDISPADALSAAQDSDPETQRYQQTEALFYAGQFQLIQGDQDQAIQLFRQTLDLGVTVFIEYGGAKAELERLGVN